MEPTTELLVCALVIEGCIINGRALAELPKMESYARTMSKIIDKIEEEVVDLRRKNAELRDKNTQLMQEAKPWK